MTDEKLYTSLTANTIMAILTNHVQRTRLITSSTEKHYSLDSEDDFRSGCRNVSHQLQFFSVQPSPGRLRHTNYWYSWVQTIDYMTLLFLLIDLIVFQLKLMHNALFSDNTRDDFKEMSRVMRTIIEKLKSQVTSGEEGIDFIWRFYWSPPKSETSW